MSVNGKPTVTTTDWKVVIPQTGETVKDSKGKPMTAVTATDAFAASRKLARQGVHATPVRH